MTTCENKINVKWGCESVLFIIYLSTLYTITHRETERHTSHKEISKTKMGNVYFCRFTWWWIFSSSVAQMYVTLDSFVIKENINHNKINFGLCVCVFLFPSFFLLLNKLNLCMCVFCCCCFLELLFLLLLVCRESQVKTKITE